MCIRDRLAPPLGGPTVEVCAVAKRDLQAGEVLDEYGMYCTYGEAVNVEEMSARQYLPEGLVEGCRLKRPVAKDQVLTYADVCLLYTSDAADERSSVDLGGRRI